MATVDKDFKVKHGLNVTNGATFGGTVAVATPTDANHAATKDYVDSIIGSAGVVVGDTAPSSPVNGQQWLDTTISRIKIYYNGTWLTQATYADSQNIPQHIHDTSIGGSGLIVSIFTEGGSSNEAQVNYIEGGGPDTTVWDFVLDGGSAVDNFS